MTERPDSERPATPPGGGPPSFGGGSDGPAPTRSFLDRLPSELRELVEPLGLSDAELTEAEADGVLPLVLIERYAQPEQPTYTQAAIEQRTTLGDRARSVWRALGMPDPDPDEPTFTDQDIAMLQLIEHFLSFEVIDEATVLQMTRVIGSSMDRMAEAFVDVLEARMDEEGHTFEGMSFDQIAGLAQRGQMFVRAMPVILDYTFRRHLQVAARRRLLGSKQGVDEVGLTVGFADLVGFTELSQQLAERELAEVIDRFERTAYEQVAAHGGRVVKLIGDEVMFTIADPRGGVALALALADAFHYDEGLTDVRVGLATGPVLQRDGDVFGPTVNLASRIVSVAYPGTVVTSASVRELLDDDPSLRWRQLRVRSLKHIGRVQLWTVRRDNDDDLDRHPPQERARRAGEALFDRVSTIMDRLVSEGDGPAAAEEPTQDGPAAVQPTDVASPGGTGDAPRPTGERGVDPPGDPAPAGGTAPPGGIARAGDAVLAGGTALAGDPALAGDAAPGTVPSDAGRGPEGGDAASGSEAGGPGGSDRSAGRDEAPPAATPSAPAADGADGTGGLAVPAGPDGVGPSGGAQDTAAQGEEGRRRGDRRARRRSGGDGGRRPRPPRPRRPGR